VNASIHFIVLLIIKCFPTGTKLCVCYVSVCCQQNGFAVQKCINYVKENRLDLINFYCVIHILGYFYFYFFCRRTTKNFFINLPGLV